MKRKRTLMTSHFIAADNGSVTSQLSFTFSFDPALGVQHPKKNSRFASPLNLQFLWDSRRQANGRFYIRAFLQLWSKNIRFSPIGISDTQPDSLNPTATKFGVNLGPAS